MFVGGTYSPLDKPPQFRADEFEAAMALARMLNPKAEPVVRGSIRLHDASVLQHGPQRRMAEAPLNELVCSLASGAGSLASPAAAGRLAADLLRRICDASSWSGHQRMVARKALIDAATLG